MKIFRQKKHAQKEQSGLGLIGVLLIIGALVITTGGVLVWQKKIVPTPALTPVPTPIPSLPKNPAGQCSGLNERDCLASPICNPVYGSSCPACMDVKFERCRERNPEEPLFCQSSADCPPSLGVCGPEKCPSWRCINGRCVYFEDVQDLESSLEKCLETASIEDCHQEFGQ